MTSNCPIHLLGRTTCQASVTFTPTTTGARKAIVHVKDTAFGSPQTVKLFGNGT